MKQFRKYMTIQKRNIRKRKKVNEPIKQQVSNFNGFKLSMNLINMWPTLKIDEQRHMQ